ncbi:unnamed protein product [Didymodactylos carnosus]|uniref:HCP-like protein n=2 Tax=Didymodactylos carnosus TaxID=1234261 RepID=A0A8S2D7G1_9BILA|nr:unnamed protein product [Didymodactylos carnosus]CAF3615849.1 unnamed protein product [Didymodactylos carnosus]
MYWGRNGLSRNVQAAVEYFRQGANDNQDPTAHFGYGLALLKGHGAEKNMTKGVEHFNKAVEKGFYGAYVALGWHAYEIEKNYTKAAYYWMECYNRLKDAHCAHNLGVMWSAGHYPGFKKDIVLGWSYYSYAALSGQIDSKIVVAQYNARGYPMVSRNSLLSATWSRNVAEDSTVVGTLVRNGLKAYHQQQWCVTWS